MDLRRRAEWLQPRKQHRGQGGGHGATIICPGVEGGPCILIEGLQLWLKSPKSLVPFIFTSPVFVNDTLLWMGSSPQQEQVASQALPPTGPAHPQSPVESEQEGPGGKRKHLQQQLEV